MTEPEQAAFDALQQLGVPAEAPAMADQLDKRAHQLAEQDGRTHQDALLHLLQPLMKTAHDERQQS